MRPSCDPCNPSWPDSSSPSPLPDRRWRSESRNHRRRFFKARHRSPCGGDGRRASGIGRRCLFDLLEPAGLATLRTQEAAFVQTQYVQNISEEYLAYALPRTRFGAFGASATYLGYGSLQSYDATGQPGGSVGANDMALGLSWSHDCFAHER